MSDFTKIGTYFWDICIVAEKSIVIHSLSFIVLWYALFFSLYILNYFMIIIYVHCRAKTGVYGIVDCDIHHPKTVHCRIIGSQRSRASHPDYRSRLVYTSENQNPTASTKGNLALFIPSIGSSVIWCNIQ